MASTYNEGIELSTLACLFKNGSAFSVVEDILTEKSFGWPSFGIIFRSIKEVVSNNLYPDVTTVITDLDRRGDLDKVYIPSNQKRGKEALEFIASMEVNIDAIESYAIQVSELHATRKLRDLKELIGTEIDAGKRPIDILSDIDMATGKISAYIGSKSKTVRDARLVASSSVDQYNEAANGVNRYIPTGIRAWDDFTNGLFPGRLYIVAAISNDGKSALVQNIIHNIAIVNKVKCALFTLEMSAEEVHNRFVQIMTGISPLRIEKGEVRGNERDKFKEATRRIAESPIVYDDSSELNLALLRTKIRKVVADGAKVIVIDQLEQLQISGGADSQAEYIRLNYIAYRIKAFAREMDVPIILVHQMNRGADTGENRGKNAAPQLQDLANAGEKPADGVVMIRHVKENGSVIESYFYWVKNRQGKKGRAQIEFDGSRITFSDPEMPEEPPFIQEEMPVESI